jgi:hypothetical protein
VRRVRRGRLARNKLAVDCHVAPGRRVYVARSDLGVDPPVVDLGIQLGVVVVGHLGKFDRRWNASVLEHVNKGLHHCESMAGKERLGSRVVLVDEDRRPWSVVVVADRQNAFSVALRCMGRGSQPDEVGGQRGRWWRRRWWECGWHVSTRIFVEHRSICRKQVPVTREIRVGEHIV